MLFSTDYVIGHRSLEIISKSELPKFATLFNMEFNELSSEINLLCGDQKSSILSTCPMIPRAVSFLLVFLHFGHILTKVGRSFFVLVIIKYIAFIFATFGIWKTDELWKSQNIEADLSRVSVNDISTDCTGILNSGIDESKIT